jgi:hypothetical protein
MSDARLSDHLAITRTIQQIARAYDLKRHDELLPQAFEPDAKQHYYFLGKFVDFSMPGGIALVKHYHDRCWATQHVVSPPVIDFAGDLARTTSAVHAIHVQVRHDGTRQSWILGGYYHDVLARHGDTWRIRERVAKATHESGEFLDDVRLFPTLPSYEVPL